MGKRTLVECLFCKNVMENPVILPCESQCFVCLVHIDSFESIENDSIRCGCCKEIFPKQNIRINKRLKELIENPMTKI